MPRSRTFSAVLFAVVALATACALPAAASATPGAPQPRIVGGTQAPVGTWPSIVTLLNNGNLPNPFPPGYTWYDHICGGTVIAPQWVLTAAHCVYDDYTVPGTYILRAADTFDVLTGTHTLSKTPPSTGTRTQVAEVHVAPGYDHVAGGIDIALLKLSAPVTAPAMAIPAPSLGPRWADGTTAHAAGWGLESEGQPRDDAPTELMQVDLPILPDADCTAAYADDYVPSTMACAGDEVHGGIDTCTGDSGGPLTVGDAAGNPLLLGDTSYGNGCAEAGYPGVYGRVPSARAFIDSTIGWTAAATPSADALRFERPATGTPTAAQTVTLTSTGTAPLSVSAVALGGAGAGDFAIVADTCSQTALLPAQPTAVPALAAQQCTVSVRATPTADADAHAQLTFTTDAAAGPQTVALDDVDTTAPAAPAPTGTSPASGDLSTPAPSGTPTPAPSGAPTPTPRPATPTAPVVRALRALAPSKDKHRVAVTLSGAGSVQLTFTARVKVGRKTKAVVVASAKDTFTAARTRTITLKLTAKGKALLEPKRRVKTTVAVSVRAGAARGTARRSLTLR